MKTILQQPTFFHTAMAWRAAVLIVAVVVLQLAGLWVSTAKAAEYSLQPSVSAFGTYDDNVRLTADNELKMTGYGITPRFVLKRDDQQSALSLDVSAPFRRYHIGAYDTDNQTGVISYLRRFERGSISINASTRHESSRTLENQDTDVGSREQRATRADAHALSISGNYSLTERDTVQGSLSFSERDYESQSLQGYEYYSANGLWQRTLNERLLLQAQASYSRYIPAKVASVAFSQALFDTAAIWNVTGAALLQRQVACAQGIIDTVPFPNFQFQLQTAPCFEPASLETEQNTVTAQLGLVYAFTEKLKLDMLVGASQTGSKRDTITFERAGTVLDRDKTNAASYDASITYADERWDSSLSAKRNNEATSDGFLELTERIEWRNSWKADERSTLTGDLIWFDRQKDADNAFANTNGKQYWIARLGYSQNLSEHWTANAVYQHRLENPDNGRSNAHRNQVTFTLTWIPTRKIWSR